MKRKFYKKFENLTENYRDGDGTDPRYDKKEKNSQSNRKAMQLSSQVHDCLNLELQGCANDILRELYVESVEPAPDSLHLLASVIVPEDIDGESVRQALVGASGHFRVKIAQYINRKKTPEIRFSLKR